MAHAYGPRISVASLQSAVLSRFSSYLPSQFGEMHKQHKERAWRELIHKLQDPSALCEADFFAAFILATIAWDNESMEETLIHYRGCLSIRKYLIDHGTHQSHIMLVLGPYVLDTLSMCDKMACITRANSWESVIQPPTTFNDRVRYFQTLQPPWVASASPGFVEAVHDFMHDLLTLLITVIVEVAKSESAGTFERGDNVAIVIQFIEQAMKAPDFHRAIQMMQVLSQAPYNEHYMLVLCLWQQLNLARLIWRQRSITDSFISPLVNAEADKLLIHFKSWSQHLSEVRPYYYVSGLMLAGTCLSPMHLENRMSHENLTLSVDRDWLVEKLILNPYDFGSLQALISFWSTRDINTVVKVFETTCKMTQIIV